MLGLFTEAEASAAPARSVASRTVPRLALARELTSEDTARRTGPLSPASAANVAQSTAPAVVQVLAPSAPAPAPAAAVADLMRQAPAANLTSSSASQLVEAVSQPSSTSASAAVAASGSARTSGDDLELVPLVEKTEKKTAQPAGKKKSSTALWVGLGALGVAGLGGLAVALARRGRK